MIAHMLTPEELAAIEREATAAQPHGHEQLWPGSTVRRLLAHIAAQAEEIARLRAKHIETVRDAGRHLIAVSQILTDEGARILTELDAAKSEIARLHDERTCLRVDLDEAANMLQTPLKWGAAQTDPDWMARVGRFLERP